MDDLQWPDETYLAQFRPLFNPEGELVENAAEYALRMRGSRLPLWPTDLLEEWLFRHHVDIPTYAFLRFETLRFELRDWSVDALPGLEALADSEGLAGDPNYVQQRADQGNWVARYMLKNGTWNTPIVLLDNRVAGLEYPNGLAMNSPYHLLEGHRRLTFLAGLREAGRAATTHAVWLATRRPNSMEDS